MTAWTSDEIDRIGESEELEVASLRGNGTLSSPRTIWVVRLGDDLYVRSVYGRTSAWYRGTQARHEGRVQAGGVEKDVTFVEETDPGTNDRIDAAYRTKYRRYAAGIVDSTVTVQARAATLKLVPRPEPKQRSRPMEVKRSGSQPSGRGPADWFTGSVRIDPLFQAVDPARAAGNAVTFEPGARTAWHTHPLGQTLIVTAGCGWVQCAGGPIEEIHPGDVIWIAPGEKHWHGAAPKTAMTHIAIQEALDGKAVTWLEHVSDEQYRR